MKVLVSLLLLGACLTQGHVLRASARERDLARREWAASIYNIIDNSERGIHDNDIDDVINDPIFNNEVSSGYDKDNNIFNNEVSSGYDKDNNIFNNEVSSGNDEDNNIFNNEVSSGNDKDNNIFKGHDFQWETASNKSDWLLPGSETRHGDNDDALSHTTWPPTPGHGSGEDVVTPKNLTSWWKEGGTPMEEDKDGTTPGYGSGEDIVTPKNLTSWWEEDKDSEAISNEDSDNYSDYDYGDSSEEDSNSYGYSSEKGSEEDKDSKAISNEDSDDSSDDNNEYSSKEDSEEDRYKDSDEDSDEDSDQDSDENSDVVSDEKSDYDSNEDSDDSSNEYSDEDSDEKSDEDSEGDSDEDSEGDSDEDNSQVAFLDSPLWRALMVLTATRGDMKDPNFRARWMTWLPQLYDEDSGYDYDSDESYDSDEYEADSDEDDDDRDDDEDDDEDDDNLFDYKQFETWFKTIMNI